MIANIAIYLPIGCKFFRIYEFPPIEEGICLVLAEHREWKGDVVMVVLLHLLLVKDKQYVPI